MEKEIITGILVPMQPEIELILHHMHVENIVETGSRTFYVGTIQHKKCVVSLSRVGKVASSVTAAVMIERFAVDRMIVTGVAGGLTDAVKIWIADHYFHNLKFHCWICLHLPVIKPWFRMRLHVVQPLWKLNYMIM
jgi:nucleoside phosphorylase